MRKSFHVLTLLNKHSLEVAAFQGILKQPLLLPLAVPAHLSMKNEDELLVQNLRNALLILPQEPNTEVSVLHQSWGLKIITSLQQPLLITN